MKRRVVKDRVLVLILSFLVIVLSIFLIIMIANDKKKDNTCDSKNNSFNKNEIVCGDDSDISRFICSRFRQSGYIVTFKDSVNENQIHVLFNKFMSTNPGMMTMLIDKREINNSLSNMYGLVNIKDFGINSFIFVTGQDIDDDKLNSFIKNNKDYDKLIRVSLTKEK